MKGKKKNLNVDERINLFLRGEEKCPQIYKINQPHEYKGIKGFCKHGQQ